MAIALEDGCRERCGERGKETEEAQSAWRWPDLPMLGFIPFRFVLKSLPMKKFYYHSHGRVHAVEVHSVESMMLRDQMEAAEKALAESEHLRGASPEETAARARVIRTLWEGHGTGGAGEKKKNGDEDK